MPGLCPPSRHGKRCLGPIRRGKRESVFEGLFEEQLSLTSLEKATRHPHQIPNQQPSQCCGCSRQRDQLFPKLPHSLWAMLSNFGCVG